MKHSLFNTVYLFSCVLLLVACSNGAQQESTLETETSGSATIPITAEALVGDWARVLQSNRNPDNTAHYWLRVSDQGTFALTTNKMQFDTNVDHKGTYSVEGDQVTFNAESDSRKCVGQSATYQMVMYADGSLEFLIVDVPCEKWLNMGAGKLGEDTIWVKLDG